jgi:signal transduction histidine kinase
MPTVRHRTIRHPGTASALAERWAPWLTIPVYLACLLAFLGDVLQEVFMLFGLFYLPLVCTAVFHRDPRAAWWLAGFASLLITIGFFFPVMNPDTAIAMINRALSVAAIFITAALVRHARTVQDHLAEQTARAEAAEQLKTEVFTTLSNELRQPLHHLAGLAGVMMADCRPDQRESLGHVQRSGQRLVATIDNLIDLTQLDDHPLQNEAVDVDAILRQAEQSTRSLAAERQIMVALDADEAAHHIAHGDPWAIRRIVENILTNALKFSPPGSVVELTTETSSQTVSVIIRDTGHGMPESVLRRLAEPFLLTDSSLSRLIPGAGSGLTLSRGLATAMGAELEFDSEIGSGTTVTLRLPV